MQVVLKAFDAATEAIGLAGEVAADLLLELIAALLQFFDFPFQGLALLLQFLQGQLLPARFRRWCAFHCAMCSSQQCDSGADVFREHVEIVGLCQSRPEPLYDLFPSP